MTGTTVATAGTMSTAAYFVTKYFIKAALNREETKLFAEAEKQFKGKESNEEFLTVLQSARESPMTKDTEKVVLTTSDGEELIEHWYPSDCPKRLILAMHGWRSSWERDFALTVDFLHENQFVEQRGQCESGGEYMGFGLTERYDCLEWIKWLMEENAKNFLFIFMVFPWGQLLF